MASCTNSKVKQVLLALLAILELLNATGDSLKVGLDLSLIAVSLQFLESLLLLQTNSGVVDLEDIDGILVVQTILVDTNDGLCATVDTGLSASCCLLDTHLGQTSLDSLCHTAKLLNLLDVSPSLGVKFLSELLNIVRTCPWIDVLANLSLVLDVDLGVTSDTGREVGRQSDSLVESIGVQ